MDLPRADAGNVQHMMALRREQHVEQVEQIVGNPVIEEKRQEASSSPDPVMQDNEEALVQGHENPSPRPTVEELDKHELTHVVFRLVQTLFRAGQGKIHIDASQHTRVVHQRSSWIGCSSRVKNRGFNCLCVGCL